jgi:hypothetical protein
MPGAATRCPWKWVISVVLRSSMGMPEPSGRLLSTVVTGAAM